MPIFWKFYKNFIFLVKNNFFKKFDKKRQKWPFLTFFKQKMVKMDLFLVDFFAKIWQKMMIFGVFLTKKQWKIWQKIIDFYDFRVLASDYRAFFFLIFFIIGDSVEWFSTFYPPKNGLLC